MRKFLTKKFDEKMCNKNTVTRKNVTKGKFMTTKKFVTNFGDEKI